MNSVVEKIKEFGGMGLGLLVLLALISVPLVFIVGSVWAAKHLLQPLIVVGWFAVAIDLLAWKIHEELAGADQAVEIV